MNMVYEGQAMTDWEQSTIRKRKERICRRRLSLSVAAVAFCVCVCVFGILSCVNPEFAALLSGGIATDDSTQAALYDVEQDGESGNLSPDGYVSEANSTSPLLVNRSHPLPDDYPIPQLAFLAGKTAVSDSDIMVAAEIEQPLVAMLADAQAFTAENICVNSGYRSREEQAMLYEEASDKSYVQPPGSSEHETGLAVDLLIPDDASQQWLTDNAWRYGFILRYPVEKESITGISYEPWHFRYVGLDIAAVCYQQNLCLEEYVDYYGRS
jgi:LAS superfamily LD-carboxypeptidase LdcB